MNLELTTHPSRGSSVGPLTSCRTWTRVGAGMTLLALAVDPFAQQMLRFRQETRFTQDDRDQAAVPRAERYFKGNRVYEGGDLILLSSTDTVHSPLASIKAGTTNS